MNENVIVAKFLSLVAFLGVLLFSLLFLCIEGSGWV